MKTSPGRSRRSTGSSSRKSGSGDVYRLVDDDKDDEDDKDDDGGVSAKEYLNKLIESGAPKDEVANQISLALKAGEITSAEAANLRKTFTPRGVAY